MTYLYHFVPENLEGTTLYPLNILKEKYTHLYEEKISKYEGREHILQQQIPILNCLWNDVLHFSAVDPKEIKDALIESGRNPDFTFNYYQIDPKLLNPQNTLVYLYTHPDSKEKMSRENFELYNPNDLEKFSLLPEATKEYYKQKISKGEKTLLHHRVPHILYKGTLDITNLPILSA